MIDNSLDDWRIAMTWQRVLQIGVEVTSKRIDFFNKKKILFFVFISLCYSSDTG